jgi:hypothetical protein
MEGKSKWSGVSAGQRFPRQFVRLLEKALGNNPFPAIYQIVALCIKPVETSASRSTPHHSIGFDSFSIA